MSSFSGKIEIINHFDDLINRVDIDIDSCLEKYNDQQILSQLRSQTDRSYFQDEYDKNFRIEFNEAIDFSLDFSLLEPLEPTDSSWSSFPQLTNVIDYLKQVRMKTIEELKGAQENALECYKLNSSLFKSQLLNCCEKNELKSKLFADTFYFSVVFKQTEKRFWAFNLFTFVTDFYLSQSEIESLEKLINAENEPYCVFDERMVLIGLLYKKFIVNLLNFPNSFIYVRKQDVLNIRSISFGHYLKSVNLTGSSDSIDLTKLVLLTFTENQDPDRGIPQDINIEGLSSLRVLRISLNRFSSRTFSIRNLCSLKLLSVSHYSNFNESQLFDHLPSIETLYLTGNFYYFSLDNLVNLKELVIQGTLTPLFNFDIFKNLCNRLESLKVILRNINNETLFELFDAHRFPNLLELAFIECDLGTIGSDFFHRFPMLQELYIEQCDVEAILANTFSNLKNLNKIDIRESLVKFIGPNVFAKENLQTVTLCSNEYFFFDAKIAGLRRIH